MEASMATAPLLIPVEEYLSTVYRPDRDYLDGEVLERNMGETPHSRLQKYFLKYFDAHEDEWNIEALPEERVQISETRFRIPDVMVAAPSDIGDRIVRTPPLLCIEILSSGDRMAKIEERLADYASMGVKSMWVIDPWRGTAFTAGSDAVLLPVKDRLTVEGTAISINVAEIFDELDRLEKRSATRSPTA
jgi:Uma2 family endonuclease